MKHAINCDGGAGLGFVLVLGVMTRCTDYMQTIFDRQIDQIQSSRRFSYFSNLELERASFLKSCMTAPGIDLGFSDFEEDAPTIKPRKRPISIYNFHVRARVIGNANSRTCNW